MKKMILFAVFVTSILAISGCTSPPQGGADTKASPTVGGKVSESTSSGGGIAEDVKSGLKDLFRNRAREYVVAYDTTMTMEGTEQKAETTYYTKGEDKIRMDTTTDVQGMGAVESRFYMFPNQLVMCSKQSGQWTCMKMQQQEESTDPDQQMRDIEDNIDQSPVTRLPDRVIAGVAAKCYKMTTSIKAPEAGETGMSSWETSYCISDDGVLLYSDSKSGNVHTVMEATKYSTTVSDSDFVPPAQPVDMMETLKNMSQGVSGGSNPPQVGLISPPEESSGVGDEEEA